MPITTKKTIWWWPAIRSWKWRKPRRVIIFVRESCKVAENATPGEKKPTANALTRSRKTKAIVQLPKSKTDLSRTFLVLNSVHLSRIANLSAFSSMSLSGRISVYLLLCRLLFSLPVFKSIWRSCRRMCAKSHKQKCVNHEWQLLILISMVDWALKPNYLSTDLI